MFKLKLKRAFALVSTLALSAATLSKRAASAVLTVPQSTQGVLVRAEIRRAYEVALGAAGVAGGLSAALGFLGNDQPFLAALAPTVQVLCAKLGLLAVPTPLVVAGLAFVLTHAATLLALVGKGQPTPVPAKMALLTSASLGPGRLVTTVIPPTFAERTVVVKGRRDEVVKAQRLIKDLYSFAGFYQEYSIDAFGATSCSVEVHPYGIGSEFLYDPETVLAVIQRELSSNGCCCSAQLDTDPA